MIIGALAVIKWGITRKKQDIDIISVE